MKIQFRAAILGVLATFFIPTGAMAWGKAPAALCEDREDNNSNASIPACSKLFNDSLRKGDKRLMRESLAVMGINPNDRTGFRKKTFLTLSNDARGNAPVASINFLLTQGYLDPAQKEDRALLSAALLDAAKNGDEDRLSFLLETKIKGASIVDIDGPSMSNLSPIVAAAHANKLAAVNQLRAAGAKLEDGSSSLLAAAAGDGNLELLKQIFPLTSAKFQTLAIIELLNTMDTGSLSASPELLARQYAAFNYLLSNVGKLDSETLCRALAATPNAKNLGLETAGKLLELGASPNCANLSQTVNIAATRGDLQKITYLEKQGADLRHMKSSDPGRTPLHSAANAAPTNPNAVKIMELLVDRGFDPGAKEDSFGNTALHILTEQLLRYQVSDAKDLSGFRFLLAHGASADESNKQGVTVRKMIRSAPASKSKFALQKALGETPTDEPLASLSKVGDTLSFGKVTFELINFSPVHVVGDAYFQNGGAVSDRNRQLRSRVCKLRMSYPRGQALGVHTEEARDLIITAIKVNPGVLTYSVKDAKTGLDGSFICSEHSNPDFGAQFTQADLDALSGGLVKAKLQGPAQEELSPATSKLGH